MKTVVSKDGTTIAYDQAGDGPIPGQNHMIKATAIAPVLTEFFPGAR